MSGRYSFGAGCKAPIGLNMADIDRMDFAYQNPSSAFDHEKFWIEDGELVGVTATIEGNEVKPTNGRLPTGYVEQ